LIRHGELVYRLVVAVDIESYSKLNTLEQYEVQADLGDVLDKAATRAGLDREAWYREIRGDGELSVLPADTDVAWVIARLAQELERALGERKAQRVRRPPLRLRVAMHYGTLTQGSFGPVGQAPIVASRLLDARIARRALAGSTERDTLLIVSASLYHDVIETGFYGLDATRFSPVRVTVKGATYCGYLDAKQPSAENKKVNEPANSRRLARIA
jgi:class 3 adenylate cyclase